MFCPSAELLFKKRMKRKKKKHFGTSLCLLCQTRLVQGGNSLVQTSPSSFSRVRQGISYRLNTRPCYPALLPTEISSNDSMQRWEFWFFLMLRKDCTTVFPIARQGQFAAPLFAHLGYQPHSATAWGKSPCILKRQLEMTLLEQ